MVDGKAQKKNQFHFFRTTKGVGQNYAKLNLSIEMYVELVNTLKLKDNW